MDHYHKIPEKTTGKAREPLAGHGLPPYRKGAVMGIPDRLMEELLRQTDEVKPLIINRRRRRKPMAVDEALRLRHKDFGDALQYAAARQIQAGGGITRDKKDFTVSDIPVWTPDEFLSTVE